MSNRTFYNNLDKCTLGEISDKLNVDYVVKIEGWKNVNTKQTEKLTISILCIENQEQNSFSCPNDENMDVEVKLKTILIKAIDFKYLKKDSIVLFLFDKNVSNTFNFGLLIIEVSKILYRIARFRLVEFMENEKVLEKILEVAEEIQREGREGKSVGALFVIGEMEELRDYVKPLILNPFHGYPEELRDVISNDLNETIKEYAQLDGAFVISNKGIIQSAGTYIDVDTSNVKRYYGWGTRHLAAVAITENTKSVAVLISESGQEIKLFKGGRLILKY